MLIFGFVISRNINCLRSRTVSNWLQKEWLMPKRICYLKQHISSLLYFGNKLPILKVAVLKVNFQKYRNTWKILKRLEVKDFFIEKYKKYLNRQSNTKQSNYKIFTGADSNRKIWDAVISELSVDTSAYAFSIPWIFENQDKNTESFNEWNL